MITFNKISQIKHKLEPMRILPLALITPLALGGTSSLSKVSRSNIPQKIELVDSAKNFLNKEMILPKDGTIFIKQYFHSDLINKTNR